MDMIATAAIQEYNGGIITVSYIISVIGAQTTLELLTRRTHIHGFYNWFLLTSAAFIMGAVGVWGMHFIGNNSMSLLINGEKHQLSYTVGYTIGSLAVACICMFIAFAFVGVTEEATLTRIAPSGVFAGLGIVCMHYLGQFAIEYFVLVYEPAYIIGAIIIACFAVTIALYIFFKLREKWMNQWYKRLGCASLMAIAVCGMHYTALVGTIFYKPNISKPPPIPKLHTPALIGIVFALILSGCIALLYISIRTGMRTLPLPLYKNQKKRLILNSVLFDTMGRILVKIDGTLPTKEIASHIELTESHSEFSVCHPLFIRLYETMIQKATFRSTDKRQSVGSTNSSINRYDAIEKSFLEAVAGLMEELRIQEWNDIGILSDIVLQTDTVSKAAVFSKHNSLLRNSTGSNWSNKMLALKKSSTLVELYKSDDETDAYPNSKRDQYKTRKSPVDDEEEGIESNATIFSGSGNPNRLSEGQMSSSDETRIEDLKSISDRLSVEDLNGEDKHIFLVKRITDEQVVSRLMSQGYRFSEPIFISKTMANKLRIPTEHMRQSFKNMQQMADSICALTQNNWHPFIEGPAPKTTRFTACINPTVCVGAFVLIGGDSELQDMNIVVEKCKEFSFPNVQLVNEAGQPQPQLDRTEIDFICNLQGRSLFEIAQLENILDANNELYIPTHQFVQSFQHAAQELINHTPYNKALFQYSKLHTTIMDLPPFSLTAGPCQMIVFKSFVNTPEILTAINHTPSDPFKCIPLSIYKSFSAFITDQAASIYQMGHSNHSHPTYLIQQQMYRQAGFQSPDKKNLNEVYELEKLSTADNSSSVSSDPFSLRPPPRAKRNRFKLSNAILNNSPFDVNPNTSTNEGDESNGITGSRLLPPPPLTVLSTGDRFWWINPLVEETLHSNM